MNAIQQRRENSIQSMWVAVALAMIVAVTYVMIGMNMLGVGDLETAERPPTIIYIAAGSYVLGGLLILLRRRWLWSVGIVINALVGHLACMEPFCRHRYTINRR